MREMREMREIREIRKCMGRGRMEEMSQYPFFFRNFN